MGKKKGKKSAAFKALKAAEANREREDKGTATGTLEEPGQNSQSLDDLNATAEDLNRQENNDLTEEIDVDEQTNPLNSEVNLDNFNSAMGQNSPEVKPLFANEVSERPLEDPVEVQLKPEPSGDTSGTSLDQAYELKAGETRPLRIRKPDTPVEESPTKEQDSTPSNYPQFALTQAEVAKNQTPCGPELAATLESKSEDHLRRTSSHSLESSPVDTAKGEDHQVKIAFPQTNSPAVDTTVFKAEDHPSRTVSPRPKSRSMDTTEVKYEDYSSRTASPRPKPPPIDTTEIMAEDHSSRTTSPRLKPPPLDTISSGVSQVGSQLSELSSPRVVPQPPRDGPAEMGTGREANCTAPLSPNSGNGIPRKESRTEVNSGRPISPRPLPPLPVGLSLAKSATQEKEQSNKPPPLPARSPHVTPVRAAQAGDSSDEEPDEVPGLRSFHRTPAKKSMKAPVTDTMGLNTVSPKPIKSSIEEVSESKTTGMIDVDLNESSKESPEALGTPAKLTRSDDTMASQDEVTQSRIPSRTLELSTVGSGISHLSPNTVRAETQSPVSPPLPARGNSTKRYAVPPPLEQEMRSKEFRKNLSLTRARDISPKPPPINRAKRLESAAEINLIANRFRETTQYYQTEDAASRENIEKGQSALKSSFSTFLESLPGTPLTPSGKFEEAQEPQAAPEHDAELGDDELKLLKTDWTFWTQVVNDFPSVAGNPEMLEKKITEGIPEQVRGIIWQLIANSKSVEFEDIYQTVRDTSSPHENSIRRDMKRTNFIPESKFESLFNVIKVYSVFDPDVGYTQGMAFIVTPLLLNTETESEAFGLLVRLMKNYGLRNLYLPEMPGLMLMLYQFDRLLEENSPQLYNHLARQGVRSSMYATQWFLTFFAYKFPLEFVLRIYDIVFVEGVESFLKFAVNLMIKNMESLIGLQFDRLLDFLKEELFYYYLKTYVERRKVGKSEGNDNDSVLKREITSSSSSKHADMQDDEYDVDQFVCDAMNDVHITPISLRRYTSEYDEIHEIEQQKEAQYESIRIKNQQLQKEVRKLEHGYTLLNREHVDIANELIKNRLKIETLSDENNDMKSTILDLKRQLDEYGRRQTSPSPDEVLPNDIRQDLNRTIKRNAEVMNENLKLQDKITELERSLATLKTKNVVSASSPIVGGASHVPREKLSNGWSGLKKVFK